MPYVEGILNILKSNGWEVNVDGRDVAYVKYSKRKDDFSPSFIELSPLEGGSPSLHIEKFVPHHYLQKKASELPKLPFQYEQSSGFSLDVKYFPLIDFSFQKDLFPTGVEVRDLDHGHISLSYGDRRSEAELGISYKFKKGAEKKEIEIDGPPEFVKSMFPEAVERTSCGTFRSWVLKNPILTPIKMTQDVLGNYIGPLSDVEITVSGDGKSSFFKDVVLKQLPLSKNWEIWANKGEATNNLSVKGLDDFTLLKGFCRFDGSDINKVAKVTSDYLMTLYELAHDMQQYKKG